LLIKRLALVLDGSCANRKFYHEMLL
jgi:hypothetical protein